MHILSLIFFKFINVLCVLQAPVSTIYHSRWQTTMVQIHNANVWETGSRQLLLEHNFIHNVTVLTVKQHSYQIWTSKVANECMDHDTSAHFLAVIKTD